MNIFDLSHPRSSEGSRRVARVTLAVLVILGMVILLAPGGISPSAIAQQAKATPTSANGHDIQFLNPSCYSFRENTNPTGSPICEREASSKSDRSGAPTENAYHLVAWVTSVPSSPSVAFKVYSENGAVEHKELTGVRPPQFDPNVEQDVWEAHWDTRQVPDGTYQLQAILFTGQTEVSRDTTTVVVNNTNPPGSGTTADTDPQGETVEIVQPRNGAGMGFYPPDPNTGVERAIVRVSYSIQEQPGPPPGPSPGTAQVQVFYTISAPGTEPQWKSCGTESASANGANDGITCTLVSPDDASQVTGVAAVASDDRGNDSGDAHRVYGYDQEPKTVDLTTSTDRNNTTPSNRDSVATSGCSPVFSARVTDQFGAPIFGVDVDAHASGPADDLKFVDEPDSSAESSDDSKAPENHASEPAMTTCSASGSTQGDHEIHLEPDRKHVEATAGTDDGGDWDFKLYSPTAGVTHITAWADLDENDRFCATEPRDTSTIGWGSNQPAGASAMQPVDENQCATRPSPTPTGTSTARPTNTATATPSRTATATPTGTASSSTTPTRGTTTPPPPPPEVRHDRDISITGFGHVRIPAKRSRGLVVKGRVTASGGYDGCTDAAPVKVQIRVGDRWVTRKTDLTNDNGVFKVLIRDVKAKYRAVAPKHQFEDPDSQVLQICQRASDVRRHRH